MATLILERVGVHMTLVGRSAIVARLLYAVTESTYDRSIVSKATGATAARLILGFTAP